MICSRCNHKNLKDSIFCQECGQQLSLSQIETDTVSDSSKKRITNSTSNRQKNKTTAILWAKIWGICVLLFIIMLGIMEGNEDYSFLGDISLIVIVSGCIVVLIASLCGLAYIFPPKSTTIQKTAEVSLPTRKKEHQE